MARYAALSCRQDLDAGMSLANYRLAPLHVHYTTPTVQPQFNKLPVSYWGSAYHGGAHPEMPEQDLHHETTSQMLHAENHTLHTESQKVYVENQTLLAKSQTLHEEDHALHAEPQTLDAEHQTLHPESQSSINKLGKQWKDDQAAIVQDLESRIRSALSHRGRRRSFGNTPKNVRSVRWDPAVLATETPGHPIGHDTADDINNAPSATKTTSVETTAMPKPILAEEQTVPEEDAKQIEVPLEDKKHVGTPSVPESHTTGARKQKKEFYQYLKSITELKKGDRKKLLQLLEALKNLDSGDDSSDTDAEAQRVRRKNRKTEHAEPKSSLDPTALEFQDRSPIHAETPIRSALKVPRQRIIVPTEHRDPNEPIWVRSIDLNIEGEAHNHKKHNQENEPHLPSDIFQASPAHKRITTRKSPSDIDSAAASLLQAPYFLPPAQFVPYTVSSAPLLPKLPRGVAISRESTKVNPKLPIIDLATGRIPDDDGPGREAHVVAWGNLILESFQQKYPLTGVHRAEPPAPIKSTHAATIQQRLEYLLMEQKEKQARGEGLAERSGNLQGSKLVKQIYQAEKDAMKRLKAEIRRDEAQRKLREPKVSASQLKFRMQVPGIERISEASTCVESVVSSRGNERESSEEEDVTIVLYRD